jgi:hypothetical protein
VREGLTDKKDMPLKPAPRRLQSTNNMLGTPQQRRRIAHVRNISDAENRADNPGQGT